MKNSEKNIKFLTLRGIPMDADGFPLREALGPSELRSYLEFQVEEENPEPWHLTDDGGETP